MENKLIVLEGIDGTGKTSLCKLLTECLRQRDIACVNYQDVETAEGLLTCEQKEWVKIAGVDASFLLYLTSTMHKANILKKMLETHWVVMDRYIDSVLAHHMALGLNPALVEIVDLLNFKRAHHTIYVHLPETVRLERLTLRLETTADDLVPAKDEATLLGRKRKWLSEHISQHVSNEESLDRSMAQILQIVAV